MVDELLVVVEDISTVDEKYRDAYREDNGRYLLNGVGVGTVEIADTGALKKALNSEKRFKEEAIKKAKAFDKYTDVDLDEAVDALQRMAEFDENNVDIKAEVERKVKATSDQLIQQHATEMDASGAKVGKLTKKIRELLVDNVAIKAINDAKGNAENLLPHVRGRVKVIETEDDFEIQVLTEQGDPAVDGEAKPIGIEALVKSFESKFPFAFKGTESTGGGGAGQKGLQTGGKGKEIKRSEYDALSDADQRFWYKDAEGKATGNTVVDD